MPKSLPLAGLVCVWAASLASAQAADPFAPHVRWTLPAPSAAPWLPSSVDFAAGGELVWAASQGGASKALLLSTAPLAEGQPFAPSFEDSFGAPFGALGLASGADESALFSIAQYVVTDTSHRRTEISRRDAHGDAAGAPFPPVWRRDMALIGNGTAKLAAARDGSRVVCATHDALFQMLDLEWLDAATGAVQSSRVAWSATLRQMAASADLESVAVVVGAELRVYDDAALVVHAESLASSSNALALSGDGHTLAVGSGSKLRVLDASSGSWLFARELSGAPGEIAARVGLSDDGATLAVGWWNAASTQSVRLELWDNAAGVRLYERALTGSGGALQNFVEAALVSRDGRRAAFGLWGTGDAAPEVVLVDRASASEVLSVDLGGSVRALALDATGTRVAVGFKHVHANQFGASGSFRVLDTGERDLQLVEEPRASTTLHAAARMPGASHLIFLVGTRGPGTPFGSGTLWLNRAPLQRFVRRTDPAGRADLRWGLNSVAGQYDYAIQAVGRVPGQGLRATAAVVEPVIF